MLALFFPVSTAAVLSGGAAATILSGQLHRERGFVSPSLVANLRRDLATLAEAGRFERAGSVSSDGASDELRSALKARPVVQGASEGDTDAFWTLHASLDAMRTQLEPALGRSLSSGMEVSNLRPPPPHPTPQNAPPITPPPPMSLPALGRSFSSGGVSLRPPVVWAGL